MVLVKLLVVVVVVQIAILVVRETRMHAKMKMKPVKSKSPTSAVVLRGPVLRAYTLSMLPRASWQHTEKEVNGTIVAVCTPTSDALLLKDAVRAGRVSHVLIGGSVLRLTRASKTSGDSGKIVFAMQAETESHLAIDASSGVPNLISDGESSDDRIPAVVVLLAWLWPGSQGY